MDLKQENVTTKKIDVSNIILAIVKIVVFLWDFFTFPIYQAIYKPWEKRKRAKQAKSSCLSQYTTDSQMVFEAPEISDPFYTEFIRSKPQTIADAWKWAVSRYKSKPLLGTREILKEEDEIQKSGKMFTKYDLGDYRWVTYEDVDYTADYLGRALRSLGLEHGAKVCVFADTKAEWFITAQACFKQGFPVVTLYTNLGEEAVVHGVNETEVTHIVTSHELLPKFRNILKQTPKVTHVVYMDHQVENTKKEGYPDNVQILSFYDVVHTGKKLAGSSDFEPVPPKEGDIAIIMYTSGSTGAPKGVMISHRNMLATIYGFMRTFKFAPGNDETYIAYLPLAHVLELIQENVHVLYGTKLGYSSPNT